MTNVVRFPFDRARPSGSGGYAWPPCQVLPLPVIRVEREDYLFGAPVEMTTSGPTPYPPTEPPKNITGNITGRRKRRAKR